MFGTEHLLWLAVCAAVIVAGSVLAVKKQLSLKTALTILCAICVVSEVVKLFCVLIAEERVNKYGVFIKESDLPSTSARCNCFSRLSRGLPKTRNYRIFC